jgi:hypothetical protein
MMSSSDSLQQTLDGLAHWANDWQLTINVDKCLILPITTKYILKQLNYYIIGIPFPWRNSAVDVNNVVSKAQQRLTVLFRGFSTRNIYVYASGFYYVHSSCFRI